jgi:hypothetical protein
MTKVKSIFVKNLRAINSENLQLNGCTAIILGGNNKGKTTLTKALIERLRGIKPEHILKQGEANGMYVMELTNGDKLEWTVNGTKEKLKLITPNNVTHSITKEISSYYFPKGFDVDKFLNETPSEQRKALQRISGLDFSDVDKRYKEAYENRTYANKRLQEEKAKEILFEPHWAETLNEEEILNLEKEINSIEAHNLQYKNIQEKVEEKKSNCIAAEKLIREYEEKIAAIQIGLSETKLEIKKGEEWLNREDKKPKDEKYKNDLKEKLIDKIENEEAIKRKKELEKAEQNAIVCEEEIQTILRDKDEMIRLADMPEGFEFDDITGGIKYNGFPFDKKNLSSSAIYIGALKLAAKTLGEVRTIHFDASYLDKNSLSQIADWAEKNNLQLLIERPDYEGGEIRYEIIED